MVICVRTNELEPGVKVVILSGRLDVEALERDYPTVRQVLAESAVGVVVDLARVEFVSSAGLRMLMLMCRDAQGAGKAVAFIRPQPSVYKIFKVAGLDGRLPVFEEEASAIAQMVPAAVEGGVR